MNGDGHGHGPETMLQGIEDFGANLANLAGLQARLAALDLRAAMAISIPALIALGMAFVTVTAGAVVGLFGLALWAATAFAVTPTQAFLFAALAALLLSGLAALVAIRRLQTGLASFNRSNEELQRNLAWLGNVLAHSGR